MKRVPMFVLSLLVLALAAPRAVEAQSPIKFGAHVAYADKVTDGAFGLGARVGVDLPAFPLSFWGHGDYYFPDSPF